MFLGSQNSEKEVQRFPVYSLPSHTGSFRHYQRPHQTSRLLQLTDSHWHITVTKLPSFASRFPLGVVRSVGFGKCVMTPIHRCI